MIIFTFLEILMLVLVVTMMPGLNVLVSTALGRLTKTVRLLELCSNHHLCTTSSFFPNNKWHKASWMHPRSKHWHQLDHVITRRRLLCSVRNTRTYHSADCNTDNSLVLSKVVLKPRSFHLSKTKCLPRINTGKTTCPIQSQKFVYAPKKTILHNSSHTLASA